MPWLQNGADNVVIPVTSAYACGVSKCNRTWMTTKQTLKYGTVNTVKFIVTNSDVKWLIDKNKILYRGC